MWESKPLGEIAEIEMGQSPPSDNCNTHGEGIPLLNGPTEFGPYSPSPVQYTTDVRKTASTDDLLFCVRGSTTGRMNWADQPYAIGRGVAALRHKSGSEYRYFLKGLIDYKLANLLAAATGSTFPNVSRGQLEDLECPVPPLPEQRAIAEILGSLDDKIELNRRMNETLEAMARAIFTSWFVDFDPVHANRDERPSSLPADVLALFPDRFVDSELGMIPAGWEVVSAIKEYDVTLGQSPPGSTYNEEGSGLPFYQGSADFAFRYPEYRVYCTEPKRQAKANDTLVSVRAPVGDVNMAIEKCCVGRGLWAIRHKSGSRSYTYYAMKELKEYLDRFNAEGTVFGSLSKQKFKSIPVIAPPKFIVETFEKQVSAIDDLIKNNVLESRTLAELRDTLLPKLISGELRVPETIIRQDQQN